jgi:hypothetical protein
MARDTTGLALGGVGGFNAHDAGALKALYDCGLEPDIMTCTSGAIFWVYMFLTNPEGIPEEVQRQADKVRGANALSTAFTGIPGVFAPAYRQYWTRWLRPWRSPSVREFLNRLLPAQVYLPERTQADFAAMAAAFNESEIPIVFNAFAIASGREFLFCNPAAFAFLGVAAGAADEHRVAGRDVLTEYRPIDGGAVEAALWLVLYGFDHEYDGQVVIDGAYHRQLILAELTTCDVIYAVKPQADAWSGTPPANYFEVEDFKTEMWFNSSFAAEVAALEQAPHPPRIERITLHRPLGYFNYFVEKMENYREGYAQAKEVFERNRASLRSATSRSVVRSMSRRSATSSAQSHPRQ